jgi:Rad3-related DNA helicase
MNSSDWKNFTYKNDHITAKADKIFDILSEATKSDSKKIQPEYEDDKEEFGDEIKSIFKNDKDYPLEQHEHTILVDQKEILDQNLMGINRNNIREIYGLVKKAVMLINILKLQNVMQTSYIEQLLSACRIFIDLEHQITLKEGKANVDKKSLKMIATEKKERSLMQRLIAKRRNDLLNDFLILITRKKIDKKEEKTFGIWCFNPGYCFSRLQELGTRSIILTSGTLSPMKSFALELQTEFQIELENKHVIDSKQVRVGVLAKGVDGN